MPDGFELERTGAEGNGLFTARSVLKKEGDVGVKFCQVSVQPLMKSLS